MKILTTISCFFLLCIYANAQDSLRISVLSNIKDSTIQLRWGVNSPLAWKLGNQYGYRVERYTVVRDNIILEVPEKIVLAEVVKPKPLEEWEVLATENQFAAIIAQALFGETFQLQGSDGTGISQIMALAQEQEQRFLFSMYAADLCFPAALLAGWGWEDNQVKEGERYLYRIISLTPQKLKDIEMGSTYVTLTEDEPLPEPQELTSVFGDKNVLLTWNYGILKHIYNAYYIERSVDGTHFHRINEVPFTNMNTEKHGKPSDRMYYIDTLSANNVPYSYRVLGVNAFGEVGPPSLVVKGKGEERLIYVPHITRAIPNANGGIDIEWEFDEKGNDAVKNFQLLRSNHDRGPYETVETEIAGEQRKVFSNAMKEVNYYVIEAIPHVGESTSSMPVLVQPADTIPPAIPTGLSGTVDTLGIVKLEWTANTDKDILGYRIYRGQTTGEELIPLTDTAIVTPHYVDTLDIYNLNTHVFYAITALDHRYNQSNQSEIIDIKKPEVVPPSPPVISQYQVTPQGILLKWVTGRESNLAKIELYRKTRSENPVLVFSTEKSTETEFVDSLVHSGATYTYFVKSVSQGGLSSHPSPQVTLIALETNAKSNTVTDFRAKKNRKNKSITLEWNHSLSDVKLFEIYKKEAGKQSSLWKVIKGFEKTIEDTNVSSGASYEYMIRPVFAGGKNGLIAKVEISN